MTEACLAGIGFPDTYPRFLVEKLLDWQEISNIEEKPKKKKKTHHHTRCGIQPTRNNNMIVNCSTIFSDLDWPHDLKKTCRNDADAGLCVIGIYSCRHSLVIYWLLGCGGVVLLLLVLIHCQVQYMCVVLM
jgi:hypothetical protein